MLKRSLILKGQAKYPIFSDRSRFQGSVAMGKPRLPLEDYTVGLICALPIELAAAQLMLDEEHEDLPQDVNDSSIYTLGRIGEHSVVIACPLFDQMGTYSTAVVASKLISRFPRIRFGLMVGIGGGVPSAEHDIRLGDVVVALSSQLHGGVIQCDFGKSPPGVERTGLLNSLPRPLLSAIAELRAKAHLERSSISKYLSSISNIPTFSRKRAGPDVFFEPNYKHVGGGACDQCSESAAIERKPRENEDVVVHYGTIASGSTVLKDGVTRDRLSSDMGGVLCFEMEAAGLMDSFPCLVTRGICDYADSHRSKQWQPYAAATAAAFAKELLSVISAAAIDTERTVDITIPRTQEEIVYDLKLLNIDKGHQGNIISILRWVALSRRPLSIIELGFAALKPPAGQSASKTEQITRNELKYCGGLCNIQDDQVYLIDQSVKDHLLRDVPGLDHKLNAYHINKDEAEAEIADTCFKMLQSSLQSGELVSYSALSTIGLAATVPLLEYAVLFWHEHARQLSKQNAAASIDASASFYSTGSVARSAWYSLHHDYRKSHGLDDAFFPPAAPSTFSAMHLAAYTGMEALGAALLSQNADIASLEDSQGREPLAYAAFYGHASIVKLLHSRIVENPRSTNGNTVLHFAAEGGAVAVMELLLRQGANVEDTNYFGETALHIAARKGELDVARTLVALLLEHGASVNISNSDGWTPLHNAASDGNVDIVKKLLASDSAFLLPDSARNSALRLAVENGHQAVGQLIANQTGQKLSDFLEATPSKEPYNPCSRIANLLGEASKSDSDTITVDVEVSWELLKFVKEELKEDYDLDQVLSLSGHSGQAVALTCGEYMSKIWPETGQYILNMLQSALQLLRRMTSGLVGMSWKMGVWKIEMTLQPEDMKNGKAENILVCVTGKTAQVVGIVQQIAWLATVFRPAKMGPLCYSMISIQKTAGVQRDCLAIRLLPLKSEDPGQDADSKSQCWHPLFRNSVLSYGFPVPKRNGELGIEIPYSVMTTLAKIDISTEIKPGVVLLEGRHHLIYPTKSFPKSIQWHLLPKQTFDDLETVSYDEVPSNWKDLRCFLGYCQEAEVLVGTSLYNDTKVVLSDADRERGAFRLKDNAFTASLNLGVSPSPVTIGGTVGGTVQYTNSQSVTADESGLGIDTELVSARDDPMIVYDVSNQRGWLVPELCVILWLAHAFIRRSLEAHSVDVRKNVLERTQSIHAEVAGNGGQAALDTLKLAENQGAKLWTITGESKQAIFIDVIRYVLRCFQKRKSVDRGDEKLGFKVNPRPRGLCGWEAAEIVEAVGVKGESYRKEIPVELLKKKILWWSIGRDPEVLVLFSEDVGQLIRPAENSKICNAWQEVPGKQSLLAASIPCILKLTNKHTSNEKPLIVKLSSKTGWNGPEGDFPKCESSKCNFVQKLVAEGSLEKHYYVKILEDRMGLGGMVFGDPSNFQPGQCREILAVYQTAPKQPISCPNPVTPAGDGTTAPSTASTVGNPYHDADVQGPNTQEV